MGMENGHCKERTTWTIVVPNKGPMLDEGEIFDDPQKVVKKSTCSLQ